VVVVLLGPIVPPPGLVVFPGLVPSVFEPFGPFVTPAAGLSRMSSSSSLQAGSKLSPSRATSENVTPP
jgi:hypothetical protein